MLVPRTLVVLALVLGTAPPTVIAVEPDLAYALRATRPVAPGVVQHEGTVQTAAGRQVVTFVDVAAGVATTRIEGAISNERVERLELTTDMAERLDREGHRVVAGINGDFWGSKYEPYGIHIQNSELVVANRQHAAVGRRADGRVVMGEPRVAVHVTRPGGGRFTVRGVNIPRPSGSIVLYTARFDVHTRTSSAGTEVELSGVPLPLPANGTFTGRVERVRPGAGSTPLRADRVVLSGTGSGSTFLKALAVGQSVSLSLAITPGWATVTDAIGGREWLVRGGANVAPGGTDFYHEPQPRSALGLRQDGTLLMVTVAGRRRGFSKGLTLGELADLLRSRGAVTAFNLDGGGSSVIAARVPGDRHLSVVSHPSDGYERAVSNALLVVSTAPTGPLSRALITPPAPRVLVGSELQLGVKGHDAAYNAVTVAPAQVAWSMAAGGGTVASVDPVGTFRAVGPGTATVRAAVGAVAATTPATVVSGLRSLSVEPDLLVVPRGGTQTYRVTAKDASGPVHVSHGSLTWAATGGVGAVTAEGVLTAGSTAASGTVVARGGGVSDAARVTVGDPVLVGAGAIASCPDPVTGERWLGDEQTAALLGGIAGTVFTAGDNAYTRGFGWQYNSCYGDSWGRYLERTRPTPGDVDYSMTGAYGYYGYFGERAGEPEKGYYAYDLGAWRVYALNSNCARMSGCGAGSPQDRWLAADIAAHVTPEGRRCVAAYFHHAPFSSGRVGDRAEMRQLLGRLEAGGVDVVIGAQDFHYERFARMDRFGSPKATGFRTFVVGTGGRDLVAPSRVRANSEVRRATAFGVLALTLRPAGYDWRFRTVSGALADSGSAACG